MMEVERNNRDDIEREFLALVLNKNEVIDIMNILPKYLHNKEHQKILEYSIDCYKKYQIVNVYEIIKEHADVDCAILSELYADTFYHQKAWKEQLKLSEQSIIKFYKEDIVKGLNEKVRKGEITYDDFVSKVKKLDDIKLEINDEDMLTIDDIDMKQDEDPLRITSSIYKLDQAVKGFALGQLSVWSGGNASAKSTFLNQIAIETIQQGYKIAIYSGELPAKRLLKWITMQCAGKRNMLHNSQKDYWYIPDDKKNKIQQWLNKRLFIYNNDNGNQEEKILNSIRRFVEKHDIKVVILDNLMSMDLGNDDKKYDMQSKFIQKLSALAKELEIHIHLVCHPRKVTNFLRKIDISGSADLTNIADNVFIMHRVNNDFKIKTKEMFKWQDNHDIYSYTNVIEVCKNRDFGVEDYFVGMFFEPESKRLLNAREEQKYYKWETTWD